MNADPVILVLEDERSQILTLRSQLTGLGRLVEFIDPEPALEFARQHACDAAIIDIRLPRSRMDGLGFLRELRRFDRDLAVIIRTASESDTIADGAIELRAIKRAVKSKTTLAEMRGSTQAAIRETRERRKTSRDAHDSEQAKTQLAQALGAYDLRLAAAELHRGLVHGLRNQITALSSMASLLKDDASRSGDSAFVEHARRSAELVGRMVDSVNAFLDGPFGEEGTESRASVNDCIGALRQFFQGVERWSAENKSLSTRDLISDTFVRCPPLAFMNGLRHLAEYFLIRAPAGSEVSLAITFVHSAPRIDEMLARSACVLNRDAVRREQPHVVVRASAPLGSTTVEEVRDGFSFGLEGGRTGNLNVLAETLSAGGGAALLNRQGSGIFAIEVLLPVAV